MCQTSPLWKCYDQYLCKSLLLLLLLLCPEMQQQPKKKKKKEEVAAGSFFCKKFFNFSPWSAKQQPIWKCFKKWESTWDFINLLSAPETGQWNVFYTSWASKKRQWCPEGVFSLDSRRPLCAVLNPSAPVFQPASVFTQETRRSPSSPFFLCDVTSLHINNVERRQNVRNTWLFRKRSVFKEHFTERSWQVKSSLQWLLRLSASVTMKRKLIG